MAIIPGTWEAETGGFQFEANLGKKVSKTPSQKTNQA
jgi:hypothetical protein